MIQSCFQKFNDESLDFILYEKIVQLSESKFDKRLKWGEMRRNLQMIIILLFLFWTFFVMFETSELNITEFSNRETRRTDDREDFEKIYIQPPKYSIEIHCDISIVQVWICVCDRLENVSI